MLPRTTALSNLVECHDALGNGVGISSSTLLQLQSSFLDIAVLYLIQEQSNENIPDVIGPTEEHGVKVFSEDVQYNHVSLVDWEEVKTSVKKVESSWSAYRVVHRQSNVDSLLEVAKVKVRWECQS